MAAYTLYVSAAVGTLVIGIVDFRDRLRSFLILLCSTSVILLFALSGHLDTLISAAIVFCFMVFSGAIYVASNLIREIAAALNGPSKTKIVRRTAILWAPLPALLLIALFVTSLTHEWIAGKFYSIEASFWHCTEPSFFLCKDEGGSFRNSLHSTNSKFFDNAKSAVRERVESLRGIPLSTEPVFRKNVDDALFGKSAIIPANLFERLHGCSFIEWLWPPNIPNCIKATILNPVHDAYEDFRRNLQNDLDQRIIAEFQQSQTVANILANVVYLNVDGQLQKTSEGLDRNIDRAFFLRDVVSLFSLIAAILVSLKILLYILVRLVFDDGTAKKGCALSNPVPVHSKIKATRISPGESGSNSQVSETKFVDTYVRVAGSMISNCVSCMTTHARPSARAECRRLTYAADANRSAFCRTGDPV